MRARTCCDDVVLRDLRRIKTNTELWLSRRHMLRRERHATRGGIDGQQHQLSIKTCTEQYRVGSIGTHDHVFVAIQDPAIA